MVPEVGHKFGPYEILGKLGGGGMGVVFRAWDERLHREVAVKLLHDEFQAPGMRQRFLLEARAASALNHPHICTIFDMGEQDGDPYLVMEVLEGITLKERIGQSACSSEEIVRFSAEIAEALAAAHAKGIVHRDIKPANIFLQGRSESERQVKVLDFGLAKVSMALRSGRDSRALELTAAGSTVGTLAYMSPEQARGEHLDTRSDLFSLGIVMYEMATRRTPFRGATTALAFQSLLMETPDPIRTWNVSIPRELERIILRLLAKDRSARYQTAREVEEALRKLATRGDGEWLRKLPKPDVPLVAAADPIARQAGKWRNKTVSDQGFAASAETSPTAAEENADFIRPRRMPMPENGPRNVSISKNSTPAAAPPERSSQSPSSSPYASAERIGAIPVKPTVPASVASSASAPVAPLVMPAPSESARTRVASTVVPPSSEPKIEAAPPAAAVSPGSAEPLVVTSEVATSPVVMKAPSSPVIVAVEGLETVSTGAASGESAATLPDRAKTVSGSRRSVPASRSSQAETKPPLEAITAVPEPRKASTKLRTWLLSAGGLIVLLIGAGVFLTRSGSFGQIVLGPKDTILLGPIANHTEDASLDGVVMEGLEIELLQRSQIHWLGLTALRAGMQQAAAADHVSPETINPRVAAQRLGARAYLYGEVSRADSGYDLRLDVIDVASNDRLGSVSETAVNLGDLPAAITRLSQQLRAKLGETAETSRTPAPTPLALQATPNLQALALFAQGEQAAADGDRSRARGLYEQAVSKAPDFSLAQLRLAEGYERDGAELAAVSSAARALASGSRAGDRIGPLTQITAALLADQDPARATQLARQFLTARPHDDLALIAMAHVMRSQGHMTEALLSSEQAYRLFPFSTAAYSEAAYALIGLDRYKEALDLGTRVAALGLHCDCGSEIAAYLDGRSIPTTAAAEDLQTTFHRALALDDSGQLRAASTVWRAGASEAQSHAETASAAAGMLAQAALDRALAGHCSEVPALTHDAQLLAFGRNAAFHIAVADSLCSVSAAPSAAESRLTEGARLHSATTDVLLPLLHTAQALTAGQPMQALAASSSVGAERDEPPLAAYLRGVAHQLDTQTALAQGDLDRAAKRRGYALLAHTTVAPLAQRRLADSLALDGSAPAAALAEHDFNVLWSKADSPLHFGVSRASTSSATRTVVFR